MEFFRAVFSEYVRKPEPDHSWPINYVWSILGSLLATLLVAFTAKKFFESKPVDAFKSFQILTITNVQECDFACSLLKSHCQNFQALGFDCEWVTIGSIQNPVALLQLASAAGLCCLFRLNILQIIPPSLNELLCNKTVLKVGVEPFKDSKLLKKDYFIEVEGTLDLRHLYAQNKSLRSLAWDELGVQLNKSYSLVCSNWEANELTEKQKEYAAKDALVAIEIFKKWLLQNTAINEFSSKKKNLECCQIAFQVQEPVISRFLDIPYTVKKIKTVPESLNTNPRKLKSVYVTRSTPLYHNCFMHAPDGELLCSCARGKAEWYVERGLAEVLKFNPYSIRLLFEPSARAEDSNGGRYYQQLKQNCCVVCGDSKSYIKHYVVPKEYRKFFPAVMKDHQSHDVVLMCVKCHQLASQHNEKLRQKLAELCSAPLNGTTVQHDKYAEKIKNYAKALINSGNSIPPERILFMKNKIKEYYGVDYLNDSHLKMAGSLKTTFIIKNKSHGEKVVQYYKNLYDDGLIELEKIFRKHFLNMMQPQYLPALWSINHNHSRVKKNKLNNL